MTLLYRHVDSPVGPLLLVRTDAGLVRVAFELENFDSVLSALGRRLEAQCEPAGPSLDSVARQLDEFFVGSRRHFQLDLDFSLSTTFRRRVQDCLTEVPYGSTWSYAQLAVRCDIPNAVRAVATACATNALPVVIPCHRIVRSDGALGGYLGGLAAKEWLLSMENAAQDRKRSS